MKDVALTKRRLCRYINRPSASMKSDPRFHISKNEKPCVVVVRNT